MSEGESKFEEERREEPKKRNSGISRIVGFPREEEEKVSEFFKDKFENQSDKFVKKYEREKTEREKKIIMGILSKMPDFVKKYKGIPVDINLDHIHILDKSKLGEEELSQLKVEEGVEIGGEYSLKDQFLYIIDTGNELNNAQKIVHELLHFNEFQSIKLENLEEKTYNERRNGFLIHSVKGDEETLFFHEINEAITEELAKRFDIEYFPFIPEIAEEVENREVVKKAAKGKGDDIAFMTREKLENGKVKYDIKSYEYKKERRKLNKIIEKIYEVNKEEEEFNSPEDVFKIFAEAAMNGRLLKVADLCERTYGKGSFRKLGKEKIGRIYEK